MQPHASRMRALAQTSQPFGSAEPDLETALDQIARRVSELLGGACAIHLIGQDGEQLSLAALYHPDAELAGFSRELFATSPQLLAEGLAAAALGGGEALVPAIDIADLRARVRPAFHPYLERWPISSMLAAPLRTGAGPLGMLSMTRYAGEPPYTPDDQSFLVDLADRAALAIANVRLYASVAQAQAAAERAAARTLRLQALTATLAEAVTPEEVMARVAAQVAELFGEASGALGLVSADGRELEIIQMRGYAPNDLRPWQRQPLDAAQPGPDVVRSGAAQFWESRGALTASYPQLAQAALKSESWAIVPLRSEGRTLGMLSLGFPEPRGFDPDERAMLDLLAQQCAAALQRTARFQAVEQARAAAEQAAERTARLQRVTAALGAAMTLEEVGALIVREGMAAIEADSAAIFVFDRPAASFRLLSYRDGAAEPPHAPPRADQDGPLRMMLETQSIVAVEEGPPGAEASAWIPLLLNHQVQGAFYLGFRRPHRFTPEERALLLALGQHCAQALDRTRLYGAEQQARQAAERTADRTARLYAVTAALAEALTLTEVGEVIVTQGMAALGAIAGSVRQLSPDGTALIALRVVGYPPELESAWQIIPLDAPVPMAEAARLGRPILIESPAEAAAAWPQLVDAMQALSYQAAALLPLMVAGRPIGTMSFGFAAPHAFTPEDYGFLNALAHQCAVALERARLYAATQAQAARLGALAEASQLFAAASLDLPSVLDAVAWRVAHAVGDLGVVGLLSDDGRLLELAAIAHANPEAREVMAQLMTSFPLGVDEGISSRTLRTGQAQLLPVISAEQLRALIRPEYWPYLDRFGIYSLMVAPLRVNGAVIGTLGALRDSPGRPYADSDLTMLQEIADRAALAVANARLYQQAQEAIQIRDQFLSIAAHELKTPLTALSGQAQLVQRRLARGEQTTERLARSIAIIARQADRLDVMVRTLLDVGRLERGQFVLDRQILDLVGLVERVAEDIQPDLDRHALVYAPDPRPILVDADPLRLEQVLENLLGNAVKYSPAGGTITVRIARQGADAVITVADQGVGIPEAALAQLFQRFYRAENAAAHHISGMGIGLYVVREIVTRHGGTVGVTSTEGVGSTFSVSLPLAPADSAGER